MTLELPLTTLTDSKQTLRVSGLRQYVCDDVLFTVLEVRRKRGDRTGDVLEVSGALSVRPSYDRDVDLIFELGHEGKVLRRQDRRRLDAEEGKVLEFKERMQIPKPAPDFTGLILRITMTVREGEGV